jgi:hypothetical protein
VSESAAAVVTVPWPEGRIEVGRKGVGLGPLDVAAVEVAVRQRLQGAQERLLRVDGLRVHGHQS